LADVGEEVLLGDYFLDGEGACADDGVGLRFAVAGYYYMVREWALVA
jgi:hypothetical protein